MTAAPSQTAKLLFESDFGGTTAISNPPRIAGNALSGSWQIVGGDDGFTWPITLYGEQSQLGLQPISYGPTISSMQEDCQLGKHQSCRVSGTMGP